MEKLVFIVEDSDSRRQHLSGLLKTAGCTVNEYASVDTFLLEPLPCQVSCILLNMGVDDQPGMTALQALETRGETLPVICLSAQGDVPMAVQAMRAGAWDYLTLPASDAELKEATQMALAYAEENFPVRTDITFSTQRIDLLTPREREVLDLVLRGWLNKQIAAALGVKEITIKVHKRRVMDKMQAKTFADLVRSSERVGIRPE